MRRSLAAEDGLATDSNLAIVRQHLDNIDSPSHRAPNRSRDMYDGTLADMGLDADPFTGSRYAFGEGNPVSNIELDGHTILAPGGASGGGTGGLTQQQISAMEDLVLGFAKNVLAAPRPTTIDRWPAPRTTGP